MGFLKIFLIQYFFFWRDYPVLIKLKQKMPTNLACCAYHQEPTFHLSLTFIFLFAFFVFEEWEQFRAVWVQCPIALDPLRWWHMSNFGHVLQSDWVKCIGSTRLNPDPWKMMGLECTKKLNLMPCCRSNNNSKWLAERPSSRYLWGGGGGCGVSIF